MADAEFSIWQGTLLPFISATLYGPGNVIVDLTGQQVFFRLLQAGALIFEAAAELNDADPTKGKVRYRWQPGDTDRHGMFDGQWRVGSGPSSMIFPAVRFNRIRIQPLAA